VLKKSDQDASRLFVFLKSIPGVQALVKPLLRVQSEDVVLACPLQSRCHLA
jgi:hypothetical protein